MADGDLFKGGFGGQGLYVSPARDLVIAFTGTPRDDGSVNLSPGYRVYAVPGGGCRGIRKPGWLAPASLMTLCGQRRHQPGGCRRIFASLLVLFRPLESFQKGEK
jgi:hypothetical protein